MPADEVRVAVGIGLRPGTPIGEVRTIVDSVVQPEWTVTVVATLDRRAGETAVRELAEHFGVEVRPFTAESLTSVPTATRSAVTAAAVGTSSVAEASALLAAGVESVLLARVSNSTVVVAVASAP